MGKGSKNEDGNGSAAARRTANVVRKTRETSIDLTVHLDQPDRSLPLDTGVPFFSHMLDALRTHGRFGLSVKAKGDLEVDAHHLVEDVGIALGTALREAVATGGAIERYGHGYAPLDESLARCVIDICDRPYLHWGVKLSRPWVGEFDTDLAREFFHGFARNARVTLHLDLIRGENAHHEVECLFKATAIALRTALALTDGGVASTKGTLHEKQARHSASPEGSERRPESPSPKKS